MTDHQKALVMAIIVEMGLGFLVWLHYGSPWAWG
jgi:hypothetical protein